MYYLIKVYICVYQCRHSLHFKSDRQTDLAAHPCAGPVLSLPLGQGCLFSFEIPQLGLGPKKERKMRNAMLCVYIVAAAGAAAATTATGPMIPTEPKVLLACWKIEPYVGHHGRLLGVGTPAADAELKPKPATTMMMAVALGNSCVDFLHNRLENMLE